MMPLNPFGIELYYNATTCNQIAIELARETYYATVDEFTRYLIMLSVLVIGLALLLLIKGKKNG